MGRDVASVTISGEDRRRYREKVRRCLDVLARMLGESQFDFERPHIGLEIELNLIDSIGDPLMRNADVLKAIADPAWATELGQFNLEINIPPRELGGEGTGELEAEVRDHLQHADGRANEVGGKLLMIGILPTLRRSDIGEETLSANARYKMLNDQIFAARGEEMRIDIDGRDRCACTPTRSSRRPPARASSSTSRSAPTSSAPTGTPPRPSSAPGRDGRELPFLFGHRLWQETRITLFEQATDTRPDELKTRASGPASGSASAGSPPSSTCSRRTPATSRPCCRSATRRTPRGPGRGRHPRTRRAHPPQRDGLPLEPAHLRGRERPPHLRVENRVLPAGPTVADVVANGAFYYGVVRMLAEADRPVWTRMSFATAEENLHRAARDGLDATLYWPGMGEVPAAELVLRKLLPWPTRASTAGASTRPAATASSASSNAAASPARPAPPGRSPRSTPSRSPTAPPPRRPPHDDPLLRRTHARNTPVHLWPIGP